MQTLLLVLLSSVSFFMIILVLIQRGKGGGLAGAFGGMGGQSAFGTKAGDTFTKITVVTAIIWFCLSIIALTTLRIGGAGIHVGGGRPAMLQPGQQPGEAIDPNAPPTTTPEAPVSTPAAPSAPTE